MSPITKSLVPSVSNAVAILKLLGRAGEPMGVNPIAKALLLSPSTCYNLLKTLVAEDLISCDPITKKYAPALGLLELSGIARRQDNIVSRAVPHLNKLAEEFDVAAGFWKVTSDKRLMLVALSESDAATRIHLSLGQRQPIYAGASGRALAANANLTNTELREGYQATRWQAPLTFDEYQTQVADCIENGWAIDDSMLLRGVTTVSAAVPTTEPPARYTVSATMFTGQHSPKTLERIGIKLREIAHSLT